MATRWASNWVWCTTSYSPPSSPYSLPSVLKQCGQVATILRLAGSRSPNASFSVSTFCWASIWKRNSLPIRRAGSPVQVSPSPRMAKLTPASCSRVATARVVFLARSLERARAAHPEQVLEVVDLADPGHLEVQALGPVLPGVRWRAPRVALVLQVAQHHPGLRGEARLDQHLVAPHVHDVVDVLDVHRALLHAGAAGGAGPQHIRVDDAEFLGATDQRPLRLGHGQDVDPRQLLRGGLLLPGQVLAAAGQQVRRLGVRVVPQATAPAASATTACRCSRPGTATGSDRTRCRWLKSSRPFQVNCSTWATPNWSFSGSASSKSSGLPSLIIGRSAPRPEAGATGLALEEDVEERAEPVPGDAHGDVERDDDRARSSRS